MLFQNVIKQNRFFKNFLLNKSKVILIGFLIIISLTFLANAATISGVVYDYDLKAEENALVIINTTPTQKMLAKDGTYLFQVEKGEYELKSYNVNDKEFKAKEIITISNDKGNYKMDLFLFYEPEGIINESKINLTIPKKYEDENHTIKRIFLIFSFILAGFFVLFALIYIIKKSKDSSKEQSKDSSKELSKEPNKELNKEPIDKPIKKTYDFQPYKDKNYINIDKKIKEDILMVIKKSQGIITQKNLRKHFDYSESKISLILKELADDNIISKEKRGTINYIKLSK